MTTPSDTPPAKRGRGRPRKIRPPEHLVVKRPVGRPRKNSTIFGLRPPEELPEDVILKRGYRGSATIKRPGEKIPWTEARLREYAKCQADPIYFIETYMKIVHVDKGLIPFILRPYQREMIRSMAFNRNTIITTARQSGKSTCTCGFILWYILFNTDKTVALLANKAETAREILGKVHLAYEHLPKWLQQGVEEMNKGSLVLENNSRVIASATSGSAIRGFTINLMFIDEAAFIENWDEFFTSVVPTISSGDSTKIVLVSTPNGLNHFYKIWVNAREKRSNYHPILVTWKDVPGRDEKWRKQTLIDLNFDEEKFEVEYNCQFAGSSGTLISGKVLQSLVHQTPLTQHNGLYQYHEPQHGRTYTIVCDVSQGKGLDYSAFCVVDITEMPYRQVAAFYNNSITPSDFAHTISLVAKMYNTAFVLVEINAIGDAVANMLYHDYEYENLLLTESAGRAGKRLFGGEVTKTHVDRGISTTYNVKITGCQVLKLLIENQQLIINDWNTIHELSTFSKKGRSYEAEPGTHDDLVMTLVLFAWMSSQEYFKELTNIHTMKELRDEQGSENEVFLMSLDDTILDDAKEYTVRYGTGTVSEVGGDAFDKLLAHDTDDYALEQEFNKLFG